MTNNRVVNIIIIICYYIVVVLPHKRFGTFLNEKIFKGLTRDEYNMYVITIAISVLACYGFVFLKNAFKHAERNKLCLYMATNIILAAIVINLLFVINIEVIHFPQYAVFSILLFPLIGNYTATIIWATLGGMLDEAYQYFYLAPKDTSYYDMNDVVTNLVGVMFGILLLRSLSIKEYSRFQFKKSSIWIGLGLIFLATCIAHLSGILSIYPNDDRPYHILRSWPEGFWTTVHPNVTFHVIRPIEGVILTVLLWVFFSRLSPNSSTYESR